LGGIVCGRSFAFGTVRSVRDFELDAEEAVHFVDDGAGLGLGEFVVGFDGFRWWGLEVGAVVVVFADVEGVLVAAGAFAHVGVDEAAKLVEEFGLLVEGEVALGGFEQGLEELEGEQSLCGGQRFVIGNWQLVIGN